MKQGKVKNPKRLLHFDVLRLISMSFVVILHVLQRYYEIDFTSTIAFSFLYSVSLGLFFFSSAYFIKKCESFKDLLAYLLKLIFAYIFPAYLFTVLSIFLLPRFADFNFGYWMRELYLRTDTFYWFFLTLFFINAFIAIAYFIASQIIRKKNLKAHITIVLIIALLLSAYAQIFVYIYNAPDLGPGTLASNLFLYYAPIAFLGFAIGVFNKYYQKWKHLNLFRTILFIFSTFSYIISLIYFPNWLEGLNGSFTDIFYRLLGSIAGIISYYLLANYLVRFNIVRKASYFAKYSGPLYLVHVFFIRLINEYMQRPSVFDGTTILFLTIWTLVFYLGSLGVSILLVEFKPTNLLLFGIFKKQ